MKILYLDCGMGAAGDMLSAALYELIPDKTDFLDRLNGLGLPGVSVTCESSEKCGVLGTRFNVKVNGKEEKEEMHERSHNHRGMHDIEQIVEEMNLPEKVKADMLAVYSLIAEAESKVHGVPAMDIHFHEVGTMDAITDITAVCMLMDIISPDLVMASPVNVGGGRVKCAHGILPVPAPATAQLLQDVPIYGGEIQRELCTPTGAALLKHFVSGFGKLPAIKTESTGYGMGKKDFDTANCVRAFLGETAEPGDVVAELSCNLDDMTAEAIGFAEEQLLEAGALDVFVTPAQMKKSRPGHLLSVICREEDKDEMVRLILRHTTTLGVRESMCRRYIMSRSVETLQTELGEVRKKVSEGYGISREKYEYEDIARIAKERNMCFNDVKEYINKTIKK